jgi:PAS domain S-box-containing protein
MNLRDKTKDELIEELMKLHRRVADLESHLPGLTQAKGSLGDAQGKLLGEPTGDLATVSGQDQMLQQESAQRTGVESQLAQSERLYRAIVETSKDIIWTVDLDLKYTYVSPSVTKVLGYTVEEIMAMRPLDGLTPESRERVIKAFQEEMALEAAGHRDQFVSRTEEIERYHKDGSILWEEITTTFLRDNDNRPTGILGISRDITERKVMEKALKESEQLYRMLFENAGDSIYLLEAEGDWVGQIVSANQMAAEMHGYTIEELLTLNIADLDTPESAQKIPERVTRILKGERVKEETTHRKKDGSVFPIEICPGLIELGNRKYILASDRDITDQKLAEDTLRERERKYREFAEFLPQFVYEINAEGNFTFINRAGLEALEYSLEELLAGLHFGDVCSPEDRERVARDVSRVLNGEKVIGNEYRVSRKGGTSFPIVTYISPIVIENEIVGLRGVAVDVTELKQMQEDLRQANKKLEKRVQERTAELLATNDQLKREVTERKLAQEASRKSEEKYLSVIENASDGIFVDQDGALKYVNPKLIQMLGHSEGEILSKAFTEFILPEDRAAFLTSWKSVANTQNYVSRVLHKNGSVKWVEMNSVLIDWEGSQAALSFWKDITDRKVAEDEIRENNKFLKSVLESLTHPFYVIDAENYHILIANSAARLDFASGATTCYALTHRRTQPCDTIEHPCPIEMVKRTGKAVTVGHIHYDKDGNGRNVEIHAYPLLGDDGRVARIIEYALDVTDREKALDEVRQKVKELTSVNSMARKVSSTLSREQVLFHAQEELLSAIEPDLVLVHLIENDEMVLHELGTVALETHYDGPIRKLVGDCICGAAAGKKKAIYCYDVHTDDRATLDACKRANVISFAALPLITEDSCLGVLGLASFQQRDYSLQQDFLETLCSQVAVGLHNAILYERVQKYASELEREITDRKRAEESLRRSEERFRAIFESAQDCIFLKDRNLKYTHANPSMERLLGLMGSDLIGRTDEEIFDRQTGKHLREIDLRVLRGEIIEEEDSRTINGSRFTFLDIKVPLRTPDGQIIGVCGISRDITERKRAEPARTIGGHAYPSESMRTTLKECKRAADRGGMVLLLGESGSGKDHLARWIHNNSDRSRGPYFSINCAAIPKELAESELFGHEAGAFSGARGRKKGLLELAEGGTLLLNEIGELPSSLQSKLLTFFDTRSFLRVGGEKTVHVDARIIAATHRDLKAEVESGRFLEPLYYRLNVFSILVPALRDRREDIPILVEELVARVSYDLHLPDVPAVHPAHLRSLREYAWPGNVRELRNVIERALMLWDGGLLTFSMPEGSKRESGSGCQMSFQPDRTLDDITSEVTAWACIEALRYVGGNRSEAARILGVSRETFYRHMRRHGIG